MLYKTIPYKNKFKTIDSAISNAMNNLFSCRGFINTNIVLQWKEIVGLELANKYKPSKIKHKGKNIILLVDSTTLKDRQYITYNKHIMIEKLNQFLGHNAINDIMANSI